MHRAIAIDHNLFIPVRILNDDTVIPDLFLMPVRMRNDTVVNVDVVAVPIVDVDLTVSGLISTSPSSSLAA